MQAGRLRERVTFQRRGSANNAFGEQADTWTDIATVWAAVEPLAGREFFASRQAQADISLRVVCRYSSAISSLTSKDRIRHGSVYYDIRSVINVGSRDTEIQFMCTQHSIT